MTYTPEEARERKNARQREYSKKTGYAAQRAYNKARAKQIIFSLYTPKDDKVLAWLNQQPNKAGYIKQLIKEDMEKKGIL